MNKPDIYPSNFFPELNKLFHKFAFHKDKKYYIYSEKKAIILKKHLVTILSGFLLLSTLVLLYFEKQNINQNDCFIVVNNYKCSEYSAFSSSFYFIKNELQQFDSNVLIVPSNIHASRIILSPEKLKENNKNAKGFAYSKTNFLYLDISHNKNQQQKESVVIDNLDIEVNTLNKYLVFSSILLFLFFITSILHKAKTE